MPKVGLNVILKEWFKCCQL